MAWDYDIVKNSATHDPETDLPDHEKRLVDLGLREQDATQALWWLTEHGYFNVVERICQEALAALPKEIT